MAISHVRCRELRRGSPKSQRRRANRRLLFDQLEARYALDGSLLTIPLIPELDQFGSQIETVMGYKVTGEGDEQFRIAYGIYDTGASVITFSPSDQVLFELTGTGIPIKVPGGAGADAIGDDGGLQGDVSVAGEIIADGMHVISLEGDILDLGIQFDANTPRTPNVQAFVGTEAGSPMLPTITGTVIHNPSPTHPNGTAAWIDMTAYKIDFGELFPEFPEFAGIVFDMPDLRFVEPGMKLTAPTDGSVTDVIRIPLTLWGEENAADPGDSISYSYNPVQTQTSFSFNGITSNNHTMLFDTGAQLSVISTEIALELGLDLSQPVTTITVQGAAGTEDIPGYVIDVLEVPRDDDSDGVIDGILRFTDVPIYVLDIVPGLDGILGMNLFNLAHGMLYDPYDAAGASLQLAFFTDVAREIPDPTEELAIDFLSQAFPAFGSLGTGAGLPSFGIEVPPPPNQAPTAIQLSNSQVFADVPGSWVGRVNTIDPNAGDTHTYTVSDSRFEVRDGELYLKNSATLDLAAASSIEIEVTATDAGSLSFSQPFTLDVIARPANWDYAFQWADAPMDVNHDGYITVLDVGIVITELNATGQRTLPVLPVGTVPAPFLDVSGDGMLNILDAALILTYLNSGGQGEPTSTLLMEDATSATPAASVAWIPSSATASATTATLESTADDLLWKYLPTSATFTNIAAQPLAQENLDWFAAYGAADWSHRIERIKAAFADLDESGDDWWL